MPYTIANGISINMFNSSMSAIYFALLALFFKMPVARYLWPIDVSKISLAGESIGLFSFETEWL